MKRETLEKIGLTPGEAKVYLALLNIGQATTGPIVSRSKVSTSKTYKILQRLENKGLVSHIIMKNTLHWSAANPRRILEMIEDQEKELAGKKKQVEQILPELMKKIEEAKNSQQAEVYMGMRGIITVFNNELEYYRKNPGEYNYIIGVAKEYPEKISGFFERLSSRHDKIKLKRKFLFGEDAKGTQPIIENSKYCEIRYLPYSSLVSINIYGDVSFISIFTADPVFFVIKSREIADHFKEHFNLLWKIGEK